MAEDIQKGRKTEIDYLNGEVIRLGEKYGVNTNVNKLMLGIIKDFENKKRSPPIPADEVVFIICN